jgi:nitrite reductase (NADH) large subunit
MNVVIIGNHAAGISACETLRVADKNIRITVISKEDCAPYSRCLIPLLLAGEKRAEDIGFRDPDFYTANGISTMFGKEALRILPKEKSVLLDSGDKVPYDKLIIATGSNPLPLMIPGINAKGVYNLRTLDDARSIVSMMDSVKSAAILGGGLIGLKAAYGLKKAGKKVTVVVASPSIMSQILNETESVIVETILAKIGIEVKKNSSPAKILGDENVSGVETTTGQKIGCELVVIGKGVSANKALVEGSGIDTGYGIITDQACATNIPDVYAAGDVAQSHDAVRKSGWMNTLWPHAVEEARVAALNILGEEARARDKTSMNSFVIGDFPIVSCGLTGAREVVEGSEWITSTDPHTGVYKRFTIKDGFLVGFVLMGNVEHAGVLTSIVTNRIPVDSAKDLLKQGKIGFESLFALLKNYSGKLPNKEYNEVFAFGGEAPNPVSRT